MTRLLLAAEVAELLRTTDDFVRAHAVELGGVRLGGHPKGPLRFTERGVSDYLDRQRLGVVQDAASALRGGRRRVVRGVELLPIPGKAEQ